MLKLKKLPFVLLVRSHQNCHKVQIVFPKGMWVALNDDFLVFLRKKLNLKINKP